METKEINEAIAKHVGWYAITTPSEDGTIAFRLCHPTKLTVYPWCESEEEAFTHAPDYFNDLDAMHEVECTFPTILEALEYQDALKKVTDVKRNPIWFATAAQRAEAFLKTLGLWKD